MYYKNVWNKIPGIQKLNLNKNKKNKESDGWMALSLEF